ncbi:MAG TPA: hypothetical protein VGS59_10020 [Candidatus Acidoferrales bacterium]|nr:hypothetical protein [Candidatus Acidoferrales bacterium]
MAKGSLVLIMALSASIAWTQEASKKYPWQFGNTNCTKLMTFCWYGSEDVSDPGVFAHGNRWVSQDKDEKSLEWVTEVRCVQALHLCILARNQKLLSSPDQSDTNIDLYYVKEWNEYQIRAVGENDFPPGKECEIDTLLLNRGEAGVSMLSVPGPAATTKNCLGIEKPKTVMYKLELAP